MYGAVDFYKTVSSKGIQPILGIEMMVAPQDLREKKKVIGQPAGHPILLLAKNHLGYKSLCKLSSVAFTEGFYYYPRIDMNLLRECAEGLICLSGPFYGKIGGLAAGQDELALCEIVDEFLRIFGENFCFEVARHAMSEEALHEEGVVQETWLYQKFKEVAEKEERIVQRLRELGKEKGIRCVATNDTRYLEKGDWRAHEILMNISSGEPCEIWERDSFGNPKNRVLNPKRQTSYSYELY